MKLGGSKVTLRRENSGKQCWAASWEEGKAAGLGGAKGRDFARFAAKESAVLREKAAIARMKGNA